MAAVVGIASLALAACTTDTRGGPGPTSRATATATPQVTSTTLDPERDVVVGGQHVKARCAGAGPSVILVADYGRSMDEEWGDLPQTLATRSRVCVIDRPGIGRSDPAPDRQSFESMAAGLDGVITGLRLTRPVVVVGHSLGGPIAATWAAEHESDARALVLLEPVPPGYFGPKGALVKALPPRDVGDPGLSGLWADLDRYNNPATNKESLDPASWSAYEQLPTIEVPLYDLFTTTGQQWPAAVDAKKVDALWRNYQRRVLTLTTRSEQVLVPTLDAWQQVIQSTVMRALQS
jgi:pimeloyl-ACP methyl ester carboxylesterase